MPRKQRFLLRLLPLVLLVAYLFSLPHPYNPHVPILPANSTLGFGTILAISHAHSQRRASLPWAANLTDLKIVIPRQPEWTEGDLESFKADKWSSISRGSSLAWLGNLNALRWFLDSEHETALILEDDINFSLQIRHTQIPLLAAAARHLSNTSTTTHTSPSPDPDFWGPPKSWDIIYPGHCDDFLSPFTYPSYRHTAYTDPTALSHHLLHPATNAFDSSLALPVHTRLLDRAPGPFAPSRTP